MKLDYELLFLRAWITVKTEHRWQIHLISAALLKMPSCIMNKLKCLKITVACPDNMTLKLKKMKRRQSCFLLSGHTCTETHSFFIITTFSFLKVRAKSIKQTESIFGLKSCYKKIITVALENYVRFLRRYLVRCILGDLCWKILRISRPTLSSGILRPAAQMLDKQTAH